MGRTCALYLQGKVTARCNFTRDSSSMRHGQVDDGDDADGNIHADSERRVNCFQTQELMTAGIVVVVVAVAVAAAAAVVTVCCCCCCCCC